MYKKISIDPALKLRVEDIIDQPVIIRVRRFTESSCLEFSNLLNKAINTGQPFVPIVIDSYGGQVYSLLEMINKIQTCQIPCYTIVESKAMSCGAILFGMGKKRFMAPNATIMLHEVSSTSFGKAEEIKSDAKEVDRLNKLIFKIMSENCKKKSDFFIKFVHQRNNADCFINAKQAKRINLCTDIGVPQLNINVSVSFKLEKT